jgi:hypothetical protein
MDHIRCIHLEVLALDYIFTQGGNFEGFGTSEQKLRIISRSIRQIFSKLKLTPRSIALLQEIYITKLLKKFYFFLQSMLNCHVYTIPEIGKAVALVSFRSVLPLCPLQ